MKIIHAWGMLVLFVISLMFLFRYELVRPAAGTESSPMMYRLDRWTGEVRYIAITKSVPVVEQPIQ